MYQYIYIDIDLYIYSYIYIFLDLDRYIDIDMHIFVNNLFGRIEVLLPFRPALLDPGDQGPAVPYVLTTV